MLAGFTLAAGVSFVDDIHSLPDLPRLIIHILAVAVILVDVGAVGIALILLFAVWRLIVTTEDLSTDPVGLALGRVYRCRPTADGDLSGVYEAVLSSA